MDTEHINHIGNLLADLTARTATFGGIFDYDRKSQRLRRSTPRSKIRTSGTSRRRPRNWAARRSSSKTVVETHRRPRRRASPTTPSSTRCARTTATSPAWRRSRPTRAKLEGQVKELEFRRMFNNPADPSNCFLDIQAGAGGTEACDWASMLLRQYLQVRRAQGLQDRGRGRDRRATSPASRARRSRSRATTPSACCAPRPACTAWCASRRSIRRAAATPASPASSSTRRSTTRSRSTSTRPTCAPTPSAPRAPAASTSTRPTRRCA